jgi:hypothetical membrane protein
MNKKFLLSFGIVAPLVYIITVIIGALMRPDYSHLTHAISELTAFGAPNKFLLDSLFSVYNFLLLGFGLGLLIFVRHHANQFWSGKVGVYLILLVGFIGLLTNLFFPMDQRNVTPTLTGNIHLGLAGLLSLGTILSTLFLGLWLQKTADHKALGIYTLITCGLILISGGFAAFSAANMPSIMGAAQRITIGFFMVWIFIMGIYLTITNSQKIETF